MPFALYLGQRLPYTDIIQDHSVILVHEIQKPFYHFQSIKKYKLKDIGINESKYKGCLAMKKYENIITISN